MRSAVVATVLNEVRHIREFLDSLERQTRTPDVLVVTDGGSVDGTTEILRQFASHTTSRSCPRPLPRAGAGGASPSSTIATRTGPP